MILEYKDSKIKIIGVHPGGMQTHLFDEAKPENLKMYMDPKDVAEKIVSNVLNQNSLKEQVINRPGK